MSQANWRSDCCMSTPISTAVTGLQGARGRHRQRAQHRARLRPHVPQLRRWSRGDTASATRHGPTSSPWRASSTATIAVPLDVEQAGAMEAVFHTIRERWGRLDFLLHSIALAPQQDLHGRVAIPRARASRARWTSPADSVHAHGPGSAEPLMDRGGTMLTMTYLGADEVVPHYGVMGPGQGGARSLRPLPRDRNSGLGASASTQFRPVRSARERRPASRDSTSSSPKPGAARPFRARSKSTTSDRSARSSVSDAAQAITGDVHYVDGGFHILA